MPGLYWLEVHTEHTEFGRRGLQICCAFKNSKILLKSVCTAVLRLEEGAGLLFETLEVARMTTMRVAGPPGYELTAEQLIGLKQWLKGEGLCLLGLRKRGTKGRAIAPVWTRF